MDTKTRIAVVMAVTMAVITPARWGAPSESVDLLAAPVSTSQAPMVRVVDNSPRFVFQGATEAQAEKMQRAIDRYGDLGLDLPSLEIQFAKGCRERFGAWGRIRFDVSPWRIEVCTTAAYSHELAHAWDRWNLTDADRRMYMELRGLDAWQGSDIPWEKRGQEDLAILVSRVVSQGVDNYRSEDRLSELHVFGQITGVPVPVSQIAETADSRFESPQY